MRMSRRGKSWRERFRVDDETIRWWGRVSIGSRGCVLEVTEMDGNKAIAPPTKSEQNRSRCNCCSRGGGIVETIIEPGGTRCAILSGATVLVIASEAITCAEKNSVGGQHGLGITWYNVTRRCKFFSLWVFVRASMIYRNHVIYLLIKIKIYYYSLSSFSILYKFIIYSYFIFLYFFYMFCFYVPI